MIKAVLFDLDATLLPMDQDVFLRRYGELMATKMAPYGYDPEEFLKVIWEGVYKEAVNDGSRTNQQVFWDNFTSHFGPESRKMEPVFEEFYHNEFQVSKEECNPTPLADEIIKMVKQSGRKIILATNPYFPEIATMYRIQWAGMDKNDFDFVTFFENSSFSKPNPKYFLWLADLIGVSPEECIMVGNDVEEDMVAESLGMKVFLVDTNIINTKNKDISKYPHGSLEDLKAFLKKELE